MNLYETPNDSYLKWYEKKTEVKNTNELRTTSFLKSVKNKLLFQNLDFTAITRLGKQMHFQHKTSSISNLLV